MTRRAAAVDANQAEIVAALRVKGCTVAPLHTVGKGVPDLLVGYRGDTFLLEVKDGGKPPSAQALTEPQIEWHRGWRGKPVAVVRNTREAAVAVGIPQKGLPNE